MSSMIIKSREANDLKLTAYHGHFATRHSHNSHYLDITRMKHECAMANIAAASLANHYVYEKEIDTVVCLDGSEVIGTFLARQLSQKNLFSLSSEKNICVVAPEHDSNGLLIFWDNQSDLIYVYHCLQPYLYIFPFAKIMYILAFQVRFGISLKKSKILDIFSLKYLQV